MTKVQILRSGTTDRYYISYGATRSRQDYATPQTAKRKAEEMGYEVVGRLPDPKAVSVAHLCKYDGQVLTLVVDKNGEGKDVITFSSLTLANEFFYKLGYKPVRITRNILNDQSKNIVIDEDTPSYCDPGSEAYHSM